jgi:hypothetical protein
MSRVPDEPQAVFIESDDDEETNEKLNAKALTDKGLDPKSFGRQDSEILEVQTRPVIESPNSNPNPQSQTFEVLGKQEVLQTQHVQGPNSAPHQSNIQPISNIKAVSGMNNQNPGGYGSDPGFHSIAQSNTAPPPNQYGQYPNQGQPPQNPYGSYPQM